MSWPDPSHPYELVIVYGSGPRYFAGQRFVGLRDAEPEANKLAQFLVNKWKLTRKGARPKVVIFKVVEAFYG